MSMYCIASFPGRPGTEAHAVLPHVSTGRLQGDMAAVLEGRLGRRENGLLERMGGKRGGSSMMFSDPKGHQWVWCTYLSNHSSPFHCFQST